MKKRVLLLTAVLMISVIACFLVGCDSNVESEKQYEDRSGIIIGDYIDYEKYIDSTSFNTKSLNGDSKALNSDVNTKWKIIYALNDEIWIIPEENVNDKEVELMGLDGYLNGPKIVNDVCRTLYSSTNLGVNARSLTIEDLNEIFGFKPEEFDDDFAKYLEEKEYVEDNEFSERGYIEIEKDIDGAEKENGVRGGELVRENDFDYYAPINGNNITAKQTFYSYNPTFYNEKLANILGNDHFYLASSCVSVNQFCVYYCLRHASSYGIGAISMVDSARATGGSKEGIRPIVKLDQNQIGLQWNGNNWEINTENIDNVIEIIDDNLQKKLSNSKDNIKKLIEAGKIHIGDYINYNEFLDDKIYEISSGESGFSDNQIIEADKGRAWRVLSIDKDNDCITIIQDGYNSGDYTVEGVLQLGGSRGYIDGLKIINDACKKIYSSSKLGTTARNVKLEEINDLISYEPISYSNVHVKNNEIKKYTDGVYITYYNNEQGNRVENGITFNNTELNENLITASETNEVTAKETFYFYYPKVYNCTIADILGEEWGWFSTSCLQLLYDDMPNAVFGIRAGNNKYIYLNNLFDSDNLEYEGSSKLKPVVILDSKTILSGSLSSDYCDWKIES